MKATVLLDNIGTEELAGDWGLSFYIEYAGKKILLDAGGESCLFAENGRKLGLSLADVDCAVLSHAHYDHADGMTEFFEENRTAKLFLQASCDENCWRVKEDHMKYIGIRTGMLEEYRDRLCRVQGDMELLPGVRLIGHHAPGLEEAGKREKMFLKDGENWVTDCFAHEQSLVFELEDGIVIFNSCSHGGRQCTRGGGSGPWSAASTCTIKPMIISGSWRTACGRPAWRRYTPGTVPARTDTGCSGKNWAAWRISSMPALRWNFSDQSG